MVASTVFLKRIWHRQLDVWQITDVTNGAKGSD